MKNIKRNLKVILSSITLFGGTAWADTAYVCTSQLEYRIANAYGHIEIRSIPFRINGSASNGQGLSGQASVLVGAIWENYNSAWADVSEEFIDVAGGLSNGQKFSLTYRGEGNPYSWVSYTVLSNGTPLTATNEVISTEDPYDSYPVVCEVP